jgi:hypothetical protein
LKIKVFLTRIAFAFVAAYVGIGLGSIVFGLTQNIKIDPIILLNQFNPIVFLLIISSPISNSSVRVPLFVALLYLVVWILKSNWPRWTLLIILILFSFFSFSVAGLLEPRWGT